MAPRNVVFYERFKMKFFAGSLLAIPLVDHFTKMAAQDTIDSPFGLANIDVFPPLAIFGPIAVLAATWALVLTVILMRKLGSRWPLLTVPISLIVGGALSNIAEAAVRGVVTDQIWLNDDSIWLNIEIAV